MFLMVITDTEHPPAAGLALGLVLAESWRPEIIIVVLVGIVLVALLKPVLKDLL